MQGEQALGSVPMQAGELDLLGTAPQAAVGTPGERSAPRETPQRPGPQLC